MTTPSSDNRLLRLNVGFLLKQGAGYSREIEFAHDGPVRAEDVLLSKLYGTLRLSRTPQGVLVQGVLKTNSHQACIRCLKDFDYPFEVEISELFVPRDSAKADPDARHIGEDDYIDLTPIVREEAILAVPIHVVCSTDCKGLCPVCGENRNETTCDCDTDRIDPRFESLRALLDEFED